MNALTQDATEPYAAPADHAGQRRAIRRALRERRRALGGAAQRAAGEALARQLARSPLFLRSRHIAVYLPNDGEIDLRPLARRAWAMGKACYLPVLGPAFHNRLWFAPYRPDTIFRRNVFHIEEPAIDWRDARPTQALDLILLPLVAFDAAGNRLGMGGGFYDRTLAYLHQRRHWRRPRLIGAAHAFQRVDALPQAPWDVPLQGVATEHGLQLFA